MDGEANAADRAVFAHRLCFPRGGSRWPCSHSLARGDSGVNVGGAGFCTLRLVGGPHGSQAYGRGSAGAGSLRNDHGRRNHHAPHGRSTTAPSRDLGGRRHGLGSRSGTPPSSFRGPVGIGCASCGGSWAQRFRLSFSGAVDRGRCSPPMASGSTLGPPGC